MPFCDTPLARLNYSHNGVAGTGPQLVLIHGAGGQTRCWPGTWRFAGDAQQSIGLAITNDPDRITNHSIYALDLPGHGRSPGPEFTSVAALGDVVEAFLEAMDLHNVVLVGHSMGGAIALAIASHQNPRVTGLVIVASSARLMVTDEILQGLQNNFEETVGMIVRYSFDRASGPFFPAKAREYMLAAGSEATHADFLACSTFDMRDKIAEIKLPSLVVAAENDRMVPLKFSAALADALPNGRLVSFADCGHFLHLERTTLVEAPIARFCATL